jgi:hypothetical protein
MRLFERADRVCAVAVLISSEVKHWPTLPPGAEVVHEIVEGHSYPLLASAP